MSKLSIVVGVLLVAEGIVLFAMTGSPTSLIPSGFGLLIAGFGALALKENLRMHAMHGVALLALLGVLGGLGMGLRGLFGDAWDERTSAVIGQLIMGVLCAVLLIAAIQSFVAARRNRGPAEPEGASEEGSSPAGPGSGSASDGGGGAEARG